MVSNVVSYEDLLEASIFQFRKIYGEPEIGSAAPGRVNLIGEHVDYCDGFVLPMALPMVTIIVGKKNGDGSTTCDITTSCSGADEPKRIQFDTTNLLPGLPKWANYIKGVIKNYGHQVEGFSAVVNTNVPVGGGLSSSAALEVATLKFLELVTGISHDNGIMDQMISVMGNKSHALLIDCQSLDVQQIPFESEELVILICNSNVKHELSDSEYPTRRRQCNEALKLMGLTSYRDANLSHLKKIENADAILIKRARHIITEIQRTSDAADALRKNDFIKMGKLMTASHRSLKEDFEVSCRELDILTEIAGKSEFVLGSRMTGGGFGGCTVSLVHKSRVNDVIKQIGEHYTELTGGLSTFFVSQPSDGARIINLENYLAN